MNSLLTGQPFRITVRSKPLSGTPYCRLMQNSNNCAAQTTPNGMIRCVGSVRQLVPRRHLRLHVMICQFVRWRCPSSTMLQVWPREVAILPPMIGPYQDWTIRRWTLLSKSPSGRWCTDDGSQRPYTRLLIIVLISHTRCMLQCGVCSLYKVAQRDGLIGRIVPCSKIRPYKGQTDWVWSVTAKSNIDYLTMSSCPSPDDNALTATDITLKHIRATSWNAAQ